MATTGGSVQHRPLSQLRAQRGPRILILCCFIDTCSSATWQSAVRHASNAHKLHHKHLANSKHLANTSCAPNATFVDAPCLFSLLTLTPTSPSFCKRRPFPLLFPRPYTTLYHRIYYYHSPFFLATRYYTLPPHIPLPLPFLSSDTIHFPSPV